MPALPNVDTSVTLTVDTATINQNNKNSKVDFTDNQGDPSENPGQPTNYVSSVNKGARITWTATSKNGTDTVNITGVSKKSIGGGSDILQSIGAPTDGQITAQVKNVQVTGDENYNISFNVIRNGVTSPYTIDPKLKMNPSEN